MTVPLGGSVQDHLPSKAAQDTNLFDAPMAPGDSHLFGNQALGVLIVRSGEYGVALILSSKGLRPIMRLM
jgi:hypothetical protein